MVEANVFSLDESRRERMSSQQQLLIRNSALIHKVCKKYNSLEIKGEEKASKQASINVSDLKVDIEEEKDIAFT